MAYVFQTRAELALAGGDTVSALRLAQASIEHAAASGRCRALSLFVRAQALAKTKASARELMSAFDAAIEALLPHGRRLAASAHQARFEALTRRGLLKEATVPARKAMELMQPAAE
jgi:hypothetical protein